MGASGPTKDQTHLRIRRRGGCPHPPAPEDSSTRRGGTPGRPETARRGHRALQKIKRTFGYAVGAGPRPARRFWTYAGAHSVRPRAAEVVGPYGRTGRFPHLVGVGTLTRPPQRIPPLVGAAISRPSQTASYLRLGRSGTGPCGVHRTGFCIFVGAAHWAARKRPDGGIGPYKRSKAPPDTP